MKRFKEGKFKVLVATDVAARGLDIQGIELVIQIEPPKDTETYIHRSGRTARAGKSGTCITFYTKKTYELIQKIEDQAGIKFKRIGVPQAEDVIKASSRDILNNLKDVNLDVLPFFADTAKVLIDQQDGDAEKALQVALAYCSGHYKQKLVSKSVLNGQEGFTSVKMTVSRGGLNYSSAMSILKKFWDPRTSEGAKDMKTFRDGMGVVFDIRSEIFENFMDNFDRVKETQENINFDVEKCTVLPDLDEDGGYGGNWRDQGNSFSRGGRQGGGYQSRGGYQENRNGGGDWRDRQGGYQKSGGYDEQSFGGNWRDQGNSDSRPSRGSYQPRGGYEGGRGGYQQRDSYQNSGSMGFSQGGSDYRPKTTTAGPPMARNTVSKAKGNNGSIVYVSNLSYNVNEQDLENFFQQHGFNPTRCRLLFDDSGNSKGYGFVEMPSES